MTGRETQTGGRASLQPDWPNEIFKNIIMCVTVSTVTDTVTTTELVLLLENSTLQTN